MLTLNGFPPSIYLGLVPNICGHNNGQVVFRRAQDKGGMQNQWVTAVFNAVSVNLWVTVPACCRPSYSDHIKVIIVRN